MLIFSLAKKGVSYNNLFEEVPVIIKNSNLASTLLCEIEDMSNITDTDSFLSLATGYGYVLVFIYNVVLLSLRYLLMY